MEVADGNVELALVGAHHPEQIAPSGVLEERGRTVERCRGDAVSTIEIAGADAVECHHRAKASSAPLRLDEAESGEGLDFINNLLGDGLVPLHISMKPR